MAKGYPEIAGRPIRLFLSHRSRDTTSRQRLRTIANLLRPQGIEVIYDKTQIKDGRRWREVINAMVVACDAAAVLLTPAALESEWVLKEATILRSRHDRDARFPLLPVLLDDLDIDTLKANRLWDPVDLQALQAVSGDATAVATALANAVDERKADLQPTPLDLIVDDIAEVLRSYSERRLQLAVNDIGEEVPTDVVDQPNRLALAIARWMLRQPPPALARIARALKKLGKRLDPADAREIIDTVAPLWIDLDAASAFTRSGWEHPACRDLVIGCAKPSETVNQYVDRAYFPDDPPALIVLNGITAGAQEEDVSDELRDELTQRLEQTKRRTYRKADLDDWLGKLETRVFVLLPLPDHAPLVPVLQGLYPRLTFVFFAAPSVAAAAALPAGVLRVEPPLEPSTEDQVMTDYDNAIANFLG